MLCFRCLCCRAFEGKLVLRGSLVASGYDNVFVKDWFAGRSRCYRFAQERASGDEEDACDMETLAGDADGVSGLDPPSYLLSGIRGNIQVGWGTHGLIRLWIFLWCNECCSPMCPSNCTKNNNAHELMESCVLVLGFVVPRSWYDYKHNSCTGAA